MTILQLIHVAEIQDPKSLLVAEIMSWNFTGSGEIAENFTDNWNYVTHTEALDADSRSQDIYAITLSLTQD